MVGKAVPSGNPVEAAPGPEAVEAGGGPPPGGTTVARGVAVPVTAGPAALLTRSSPESPDLIETFSAASTSSYPRLKPAAFTT